MEKLFCAVFLLLGVIYVSAEGNNTHNGSRYITYQDYGNVTRVIDLQAEIDPAVLQGDSLHDNQYFLFTQRNQGTPQELCTNNASSIESSNFNPNVSTVVLVHGWEGDQNADANPTITNAYLAKSDVNIIVVDWSWLSMKNYPTAVCGVPSVGQSLGKFLIYLNSQTGAKFSDIHLVGFSLGAHVVGNAGRSLNTKVARITGLDPAGPFWIANPARLVKTDAVYVEAIHTNRRLFGTLHDNGHTDFAPNGGYDQPGCDLSVCSHHRAWRLFAATVTNNNLIGHKCENDLCLDLNECYGETLPMGNDDLRKTGTGIYRVETTSTYPYV